MVENEKSITRKNWKIQKHMEIKQHAPGQPMGQRRKSIFGQMEMEIQHTKIHGMQQKQFEEESF